MTRRAALYELVFVDAPPPPLRIVGAGPRQKAPTTARPAPSTYVAPDSHRAHGTYVKYVVEKCRCPECRQANRAYEKNRVQTMQRPDQVWAPYVPAGRARQHITELATQGIGIKSVAALSGLPHGTLSKLVYGTRTRKPSRRIRAETERRILAVKASDVAGAQKIDGGPTWKLLDDLIARGYPKSWLAKELGSNSKSTHPGLQIRRDRVRASTAKKVEELHRRLEGVEGPGRRSRWAK